MKVEVTAEATTQGFSASIGLPSTDFQIVRTVKTRAWKPATASFTSVVFWLVYNSGLTWLGFLLNVSHLEDYRLDLNYFASAWFGLGWVGWLVGGLTDRQTE